MKLLNETEMVTITIWQTYCEGYTFDENGKPNQFKDVIFANTKSERAAENYLRAKTKNNHLTVTRIERVKGKWRAPLDDFLSIAELVCETN